MTCKTLLGCSGLDTRNFIAPRLHRGADLTSRRMKWKRRRRSVNDIPRARAALARKSSRFVGARGRCSSGSCTQRIEFYFHSVKVVAPQVLHWPPPPRAYQTYAVFLILILPPYTPLRHRFYEAFRSAGTFCLQTRLRSSSPLFLIAPTSRYYHSLPLFPPIVYFLFFLFFSFSSPPAPFHFFFVFVYERGSLCIEYTGCASNKTFFFFTLVQIIYQLARVNSYLSRGS